MKETVKNIVGLVDKVYHADISGYDYSFLDSAVKNRMSVHHFINGVEYLRKLEQDPGEGKIFISSLQVNFSEFFRNTLTFSCLKQILFPRIIENKKHRNEKEVRIWSAACSEGQEPYSIGMIWYDVAKSLKTNVTCRIFATDINNEAIDMAKKGVYMENMLDKASMEQVRNYFSRKGDIYSIHPEIKSLVNFSVFDLLTEDCICPPESIFGNFDLVFCSNLLFYFSQLYRQRIIDKIGHCLAKNGYFVTSETEREIIMQYHYREIFPYSGIFEKIG